MAKWDYSSLRKTVSAQKKLNHAQMIDDFSETVARDSCDNTNQLDSPICDIRGRLLGLSNTGFLSSVYKKHLPVHLGVCELHVPARHLRLAAPTSR